MARHGQVTAEAERRRARLAELLRDGIATEQAVSTCMAEFKCGRATCYRDLRELMAGVAAARLQSAEERFTRQLADLDLILAKCREGMEENPGLRPKFMTPMLAALDREARLFGFDQPQRHEVVLDLQVVIPGLGDADDD